jgi:hypothetical protein
VAILGQPFTNRRRNVVNTYNGATQAERDAFNLTDWYWNSRSGNGNITDIGEFLGVDWRVLVPLFWPLRGSVDTARMDDLAQASGFYALEGLTRQRERQRLTIVFLAEVDA